MTRATGYRVRLRELHAETARAVSATYDWEDLNHGLRETQHSLRFTISELPLCEVLTRLLELNHERYEEEERQGLHEKKETKATRKGAMAQSKQDGR